MIDTHKLKAAWVAKGLNQTQVAERILHITPKTMSMKMKKRIFGSDEIETLVKALDISSPWEIFFLQ